MSSEVISRLPTTPAHRRHSGLSVVDMLGRQPCFANFATYVASNASTDYEPSTSPACAAVSAKLDAAA